MRDWTLGDDGYWTGPDGERLRAISGAQDFDIPGAAFEFGQGYGGPDVASYAPSSFGPATMDFGGSFGGGYSPISSYVPGGGRAAADPTAMSVPGGGGGFGFGDLSSYAKQALPFLGLGTQALGAYTGIRGMMDANQQRGVLTSAERTAQGAAAPALAAGQQLIPAGTQALLGGPLPPALEATVNQWANNWRTQIRNFAARSGIDASTMLAQYEGLIQSQAQELRAQLAQGMIQSGTGALQPAIQGAQVSGQFAAREGDAVTTAITAANQALARLMGAQ